MRLNAQLTAACLTDGALPGLVRISININNDSNINIKPNVLIESYIYHENCSSIVVSIYYIYLITANSFTLPRRCIFQSNSFTLPVLAIFHQLEVNESTAGMGSTVFGEE